jgi:preprotein translocase subunit SecB
MIASLVTESGFPPLVLQPVNFDMLYAQRLQQMAEEQKKAAAEGNGAAAEPEFSTDD